MNYRFLRAQVKRSRGVNWFVYAAAALGVCSALVYVLMQLARGFAVDRTLFLALLGPFLLVFVVYPLLHLLLAGLKWLCTPHKGRETSYEISEKGILTKEPHRSVHHFWPTFRSCSETARFFVFHFSHTWHFAVPKDSIGSQEQVEEIRALVRQNLSKHQLRGARRS
jgi:hypothetical protein